MCLEFVMKIHKIIAITTTLLAGGALGTSRGLPLVKKQPAPAMAIGAAAVNSGKKAFLFDDKMKKLCKKETTAILCDSIERLDAAVREKSELFANMDLIKLRSRLEKVIRKPALVGENNRNGIGNYMMLALEAIEILFTTGGGEDPNGQLHRIILGLSLLIDHSLGEGDQSICRTVSSTLPRTYPPLLTFSETYIQRKKGSSSKPNGGVSGHGIAAGFMAGIAARKCTGSLMVLKLLASFDARQSDIRTLYNSVVEKLVESSEKPFIISQASNIELIKVVMAEPLRGLKETLKDLDTLLSGGSLPPPAKETRNPSSATAFRKSTRSEVSENYLFEEIYPKIPAEIADFSVNNDNKENFPKGTKKVTDMLNLKYPLNRREEKRVLSEI